MDDIWKRLLDEEDNEILRRLLLDSAAIQSKVLEVIGPECQQDPVLLATAVLTLARSILKRSRELNIDLLMLPEIQEIETRIEPAVLNLLRLHAKFLRLHAAVSQELAAMPVGGKPS